MDKLIAYTLQTLMFYSTLCNGGIITFPEDTTKYINSPCTHTSGESGVCQPPTQCKKEKLVEQKKNHCSFHGNIPILCCPYSGLKKTGPLTKNETSVPLGVESPKLDFDCGISLIKRTRRSRPEEGFVQMCPPFCIKHESIGGFEPIPHKWPWAAAVGEKNGNVTTFYCTGSLINRKFILSAAHCLEKNISVARLGDHDLTSRNDGFHDQDFDIIDALIYPDYKYPLPYDDIVLFKLAHDITTFSNFISPVCLPWGTAGNEQLVGQKVIATGWGATEHGLGLSDVILEISITVFEASFCDAAYASRSELARGVQSEDFICAGNTTHQVDTCQGDSGGPAMFLHEGLYHLAGVTGSGVGCGDVTIPGLYINVMNEKYLKWIKSTAF